MTLIISLITMFIRTFQWRSSECLTNVTITVKVAMVAYIQDENG